MGLSDTCFDFLDAIEAAPETFQAQLKKLESELGFWAESPIYPQEMLDAVYGVICAGRAGTLTVDTIREPLRRAGWSPDITTREAEREAAAREGWVYVDPVPYVRRPRPLEELAGDAAAYAATLSRTPPSSKLLKELVPKIEAAETPDAELKEGLLRLIAQALEGTLQPEFMVKRVMAIQELLVEYEALGAKKAALLAGVNGA